MRTLLSRSLLPVLLLAASSQCFALREIKTLTKKSAAEAGIELRAQPAGPEAVRLELSFNAEGELAEFTHVELSMRKGENAFVLAAPLRATRADSGSTLVTLTISRAYLEWAALLIVMHSPLEAGDHVNELKLKDFVDLAKLP